MRNVLFTWIGGNDFKGMASGDDTRPGPIAAEAVFGADLGAFLPGDTFAVQVLFRDGSSWNATDLLTGTAQ